MSRTAATLNERKPAAGRRFGCARVLDSFAFYRLRLSQLVHAAAIVT